MPVTRMLPAASRVMFGFAPLPPGNSARPEDPSAMRTRLLLLLLLLLPTTAQAAVTKTGSPTSSEVSGTSLTYANTVAADADCLVVGVVLIREGTPVGTVSSVTAGGVAMTQVVTTVDSGAFVRAYLFRLTTAGGLTTGAQNIVVSTTGTVTHLASGGQGFKGVDQTTPVSNSNSNNGNSSTASVTVTSAAGEWTMDTAGS